MNKTFGEMFDEALACRTPEEGEEWLNNYAQEMYEEFPETADSSEAAKKTILWNLGYMTGYYDKEEVNHIYRIFGIGHPLFGYTLITEERDNNE